MYDSLSVIRACIFLHLAEKSDISQESVISSKCPASISISIPGKTGIVMFFTISEN